MTFAYEFQHLCGNVYSQGNIIFTPDGNSVLSPVGNRITQLDLINHNSITFSCEARKNIVQLAVSNDSRLLLAIDEEGHSLLINLKKRKVLYRFNFKKPVKCAVFSPDNKYVAITHGNKLQIWKTPGLIREFSAFTPHRTYGGHYGNILSITWSHDSKFLVTGSEDLSCRLFSLHSYPDFQPLTLAGHRDYVIGGYFSSDDERIYTVARDGGAYEWGYKLLVADTTDNDEDSDSNSSLEREVPKVPILARPAKWSTVAKHVLKMDYAKVTCVTYDSQSQLLIAGFSNGTFGLYQLPTFTNIHTLSISQHDIQTVALNATGEWLAFGSPRLGQLLVWEWRSETYVLKQQGHYFDMNTIAYSRDGRYLATGADDAKLKLWDTTSGFCFYTFGDHIAPITGVAFGKNDSSVISCSLDGTVRAFDLNRYKNFRTLTTPEPVQFLCVAVDAGATGTSGEIVVAGTLEPFNIYVWSLQTGKLTDVLSGHTGPITCLSFSLGSSTMSPVLASGSWDHTVRLWDVYKPTQSFIEPLAHSTDVLALAFKPDGRELCSATLSGHLNIWNVADGELLHAIDGARDIAGGRKSSDLISLKQNSSSKHFTSVCYSADGSVVLAGGRSKFVCIYETSQQVLVKKFQLSHNQSLEGVLTKLNSKDMTAAGITRKHLSMNRDDNLEGDGMELIGAKRAVDPGARRQIMEILSKCVLFSPSGRHWAAATSEGLMIYGLDETLAFDPFELDEEITPDSIIAKIESQEYAKALVMSLHLNEEKWIVQAMEAVPVENLNLLAQSLTGRAVFYVKRLLQLVAKQLTSGRSIHLEFYLQWSLALLNTQGKQLRDESSEYLTEFRALQKALMQQLSDLSQICNDNQFTLTYLNNRRALQQKTLPQQDGDVEMTIA